MQYLKWIERCVVGAAMLGILPAAGADNANPGGAGDDFMPARTIPSQTSKPSFSEVGILKEWLVKPDDVVKAGQVLGREDTDLDELQLKSLRIDADSTAELDAAIAKRDEKKIEYDNKNQSFKQQAASESELDEAKLEYDESKAELEQAESDHAKKQAEADYESRKIEKMKLISPVDGIVEKINIQDGEVVVPNSPEGAVTLVTNNPLWVQVSVPAAQAAKMKYGDSVPVAYKDDPDKWLTAKVTYMDPEADPTSGTQLLRLELNNDENKPSGLWVNVRIPSAPMADSH